MWNVGRIMTKQCYHHSDREGSYTCEYCGRRLCPDCVRLDAHGSSCENTADCLSYQDKTHSPNDTPYEHASTHGEVLNEIDQTSEASNATGIPEPKRIPSGNIRFGNEEQHTLSFGIIYCPKVTNSYTGSFTLVREPYVIVDDDEIRIKENRPTFQGARIRKKISFLNDGTTIFLDIGKKEHHLIEITYRSPSFFGSSVEDFIVKDNGVAVHGTDRVTANETKGQVMQSVGTLVVWGIINIVLWHILGSEARSKILIAFPDVKFWLWLVLYNGIALGVLLLFFGLVGLLFRNPVTVLLDGIALLLVGLTNIVGDFLAIPALHDYGIVISASTILDDIWGSKASLAWKILGVLQVGWACGAFVNYSRIRASISSNALPVSDR